MTDQKLPIQMLHKFGHCITYPEVCEIETALAELSIHQSEGLNVLQLLPKGEEVIPTFFWAITSTLKSTGLVDLVWSTQPISWRSKKK